MANRFPVVQTLALLLLLALALAGLAAFTGTVRMWNANPLKAEIRLQPLSLPAGISLDPLNVAEALVAEMQEHAQRDAALRLALGQEDSERITEIVIPRLVNSLVIRRMIEAIPALQTVLALSELRTVAHVELSNAGAVPLEDVALTLPGLVRAERADGAPVGVAQTQTGLTALNAGALEAGENREITAWLSGATGDTASARDRIVLGAAGRVDGEVLIHPTGGWMGEDLATNLWARWLVAAILAAVALGAFALLVATLVTYWQRWSSRGVRPS